MPSFPSAQASVANSPGGNLVNMLPLNIGGGTWSQDSGGTISASDPSAGTFTTASNTANGPKALRRDVVALPGYDSSKRHHIIETYVHFGQTPWPGSYNNSLRFGWLIFSGGVADGNIICGFGVQSTSAVNNITWCCGSAAGAFNTSNARAVNAAITGFRFLLVLHGGWPVLYSCWATIGTNNAPQLYEASNMADAFGPFTPAKAGSTLYLGVCAGLVTAGGPYNLQADARYYLRPHPRV